MITTASHPRPAVITAATSMIKMSYPHLRTVSCLDCPGMGVRKRGYVAIGVSYGGQRPPRGGASAPPQSGQRAPAVGQAPAPAVGQAPALAVGRARPRGRRLIGGQRRPRLVHVSGVDAAGGLRRVDLAHGDI